MSAAIWIALGAVFIALIPAFIVGNKANKKDGSGSCGSSDVDHARGGSSGDSSDSGGGDGGGGD